MTAAEHVAQLLADRVPLTLLFDIAGYGASSGDLLLEEWRAQAVQNRLPHPRPVPAHRLGLTA